MSIPKPAQTQIPSRPAPFRSRSTPLCTKKIKMLNIAKQTQFTQKNHFVARLAHFSRAFSPTIIQSENLLKPQQFWGDPPGSMKLVIAKSFLSCILAHILAETLN